MIGEMLYVAHRLRRVLIVALPTCAVAFVALVAHEMRLLF